MVFMKVELSENYELSDLQCALGISQIKRIENFNNKKKILHKYYLKKIKKLKKYLTPIDINKRSITHWHLFPILLNENYINYKKKLFLYLKKKKIFCQVHYVPVYKHPIYKKNYNKVLNYNSDIFYKKVLSLPFHTKIKLKQINYITDQINSFFKINILY